MGWAPWASLGATVGHAELRREEGPRLAPSPIPETSTHSFQLDISADTFSV